MQVISLLLILLCFVLVKSTIYEVYDNNMVIFRGNKDRFTRTISCNKSKAVCFDERCTYCQCMVGQTFVRTRGYYGECVSNELLIFATFDKAYFLIENKPHQICLHYEVNFVRANTCSIDNRKYYWIWTNNGQLLNRESLKCMTDDFVTKDGTHFVVMKKCDRNNPKQSWKCESYANNHCIKQITSHRYMFYGEYGRFVTTSYIHWPAAKLWTRFGSTQDACSQAVGCETFVDGSSIIILNKTKCEENSGCSGEKEIDLDKTRCSLLRNQTQYLYNDTWTPVGMKNGSFTIAVNTKASLKWNLKKTPKSWGGLMVKAQFKCEDSSRIAKTEHCVVIKYTGTFKGFYDDDDDDSEIATSTIHQVNDNVVIFRGDKDRFTKKNSCTDSKAVCFDASCVHCQCEEGQTFVQTRGYYGECISNELLVYATSKEDNLLIHSYPHLCLYHGDSKGVDFVREGTCYDKSKYHWIRTKNGQLLNWESLKCMADDYVTKNGKHFIVMEKCDKSNFKQLWKCERTNHNFIKLRHSDRYLRYGGFGNYVTAGQINWFWRPIMWARYGSKQDVCSQAVGCETFADGSSIITLNKAKCKENSECLGEKEINMWKTRCSLLSNQSQYLQNETWKPLEIKHGSFEIEVNLQVTLKWNLKKTPKSWAGLMVKLQFKCEETINSSYIAETEHCVVVKYTGTFQGFYDGDKDDVDDNDGKGEDGDSGGDGDKNGNGGTGGQADKNTTNVNQKIRRGEKDNTRIIIIIVGVLLALLLAGVAVFILCKYRNRFFGSDKENADRQDEADQEYYPTTINPLYPVNDNLFGQRECELYEPASDYVDADQKPVDPPSQNHTHDYATVDGLLMAEGKGEPTTKQSSPKYHVLEDP